MRKRDLTVNSWGKAVNAMVSCFSIRNRTWQARSIVSRIALVLAILNVSVGVHAQSSASVSGTVTDVTGAVIPGASVEIKNQATNVTQATQTNNSGTYSFVNVAPGTYSVTVTKSGFQTDTEKDVVLGVNQAAVLNFTPRPGQVQQTVTVSSAISTIQTSTAELGTVVTSTAVNNLPLNGRNFTELLELTPGVSRVSVAQNSGAGVDLNPIGQFTFPAVNGQRNRSNMFILDGSNDLGTYKGTYTYEPIIDDIEEFKVQSHNDLAEYGGETGGIINVVTKSGTNQFHGSLWEFDRNSALTAIAYFQQKVNPLHQNQFGASFGGPILLPHLYNGKNKTFFFFSYEGFRQTQSSQVLVTTATPAQLGGDFSNLLAKGIVIYDPFSTTPDPANPGQYTRTAFPGDIIPKSELSQAALVYANALFPSVNDTASASGNALINQPIYNNSNSYTTRLDQAFGSHDQATIRVSWSNQPYTQSVSSPIAIQEDSISGFNVVAHELHSFGPTAILDVMFSRSYGRDILHTVFPGAPANFPQTLISNGFSSQFIGNLLSPVNQTIPGITIAGYLGTGGNTYQNPSVADIYEYGAAFSKVLGKHTIKAGVDIATDNFAQTIVASTINTSTFQTSNLEQPTNPVTHASTGDAMASFLLGVPTSAQRRNALEIDHNGLVDSAYVQDQIRLTPKLSLNAGLRWDGSIWPIVGDATGPVAYLGDMNLRNGTYEISKTPPACSATQGAPCIPGGTLPANVVVTSSGNSAIHQTDWADWQPRLSVAYQITQMMSVHAGYSRFFDEWDAVDQLAQNLAGTWPNVGLINNNSLNATTPTSTIGDPLSLGSSQILPAATPFGNATFYYDPKMKMPLSDQWNLGIEQGIGNATVLSLYYAGSHDIHLDLGGLQNTAQYPAAGTAAQVASRRLYPYIVPTNFDTSSGNSNYNALEVKLNNRGQRGLQYLLSYTWSKSIDLACSGSFGSEGCLLQNPYNPRADRSVSGFDLTNIFSGSVVYQLPFGRGRQFAISNGIANAALGGWKANAVVSLTSGTPYSVTVNGDIANIGNTFVQADLVGNPVPANRTPSQWINPAAFASPPAYSFGTFGRNALRSDAYKDLDLSVFKSFSLVRESSLEFRAEAFNATNTPIFAAPNSVVGSPTFGAVSSLNNAPRELQLALKLQF